MKPRSLTGEAWINSSEKRNMDLAIALGTAPIWATIGAGAMLLSRAMDGEGVIFRQIRIGQHGESFEVAKIRTLKDINPDEINIGADNQYATPLGRRLRLLAIDEIPQIIKVISGEMSMVGPRVLQPTAINHMQLVLSRNEFDEWLDLYSRSKPGGVSSYGIAYRQGKYGSGDCRARAKKDKEDFNNASRPHDIQLLLQSARAAGKLFMSHIYKNNGLTRVK